MPRVNRPIAFLFVALTLIAVPSCRYGPAPVTQPEIDPSSAGSQAMEMYDTNGDGKIAGDELEKSPAIKSAISRLDTDKDGGVSADEIAARIEVWKGTKIGLTSFGFTTTLDGSPLVNADVTFEPEAFLGDDIKAATGKTNAYGGGSATIPKEQRPNPSFPPGMHLGFYKVRISKVVNGKETIPAKYNEETTLGVECSPDVPEVMNNRVVFALTSK